MNVHCVGRYALAVVLWTGVLSPMAAAPVSDETLADTPATRSLDIQMPSQMSSWPDARWPAAIEPLHEFQGWTSFVQPQSRPTASSQPYGYISSPRIKGGLQDKWQQVKSRLSGERKILADCRNDMSSCPDAARLLITLIDNAMKRDGRMRIAEINRSINLTIRFAEDRQTYGVDELWATPLMTFERRAGDCEDYAIAKFVALQEMGFDPRDVRIVIIRDEKGQGHAMAAARHDGRWLILDNRHLGIQDDTVTAQATPLFVIDGGGAKRLAASKANPPQPRTAPQPTTAPVAPALVSLSGSPVTWCRLFLYCDREEARGHETLRTAHTVAGI